MLKGDLKSCPFFMPKIEWGTDVIARNILQICFIKKFD
jgi:hypothetical protein